MRLLDNAAIVSALAVATGRPHMLIECLPDCIGNLRAMQPAVLPSDVVDALEADGWAITSGDDFVEGALAFYNVEQRLIAERTVGVSLRLAQGNGSVRMHEVIVHPTVAMPALAA